MSTRVPRHAARAAGGATDHRLIAILAALFACVGLVLSPVLSPALAQAQSDDAQSPAAPADVAQSADVGAPADVAQSADVATPVDGADEADTGAPATGEPAQGSDAAPTADQPAPAAPANPGTAALDAAIAADPDAAPYEPETRALTAAPTDMGTVPVRIHTYSTRVLGQTTLPIQGTPLPNVGYSAWAWQNTFKTGATKLAVQNEQGTRVVAGTWNGAAVGDTGVMPAASSVVTGQTGADGTTTMYIIPPSDGDSAGSNRQNWVWLVPTYDTTKYGMQTRCWPQGASTSDSTVGVDGFTKVKFPVSQARDSSTGKTPASWDCHVLMYPKAKVTLHLESIATTIHGQTPDPAVTAPAASSFILGVQQRASYMPQYAAWVAPAGQWGQDPAVNGPDWTGYIELSDLYDYDGTSYVPKDLYLTAQHTGFTEVGWRCRTSSDGGVTWSAQSAVPASRMTGVYKDLFQTSLTGGNDLECWGSVEPAPVVATWTSDQAAGAQWTLQRTGAPTGQAPMVVTDCTTGTCTDQVDKDPTPGSFAVPDLLPGEWTLTEQTAPTGYVKPTNLPQAKRGAPGETIDFGALTHAVASYASLLRVTAAVTQVIGEPADVTPADKGSFAVTIVPDKAQTVLAADPTVTQTGAATYRHDGDGKTSPGQLTSPLSIGIGASKANYEVNAVSCAVSTRPTGSATLTNPKTTAAGIFTMATATIAQPFIVAGGAAALAAPYNAWDCSITMKYVPPVWGTLSAKMAPVVLDVVHPRNQATITVQGMTGSSQDNLTEIAGESSTSAPGKGDVGAKLTVTGSQTAPDFYRVSVVEPKPIPARIIDLNLTCSPPATVLKLDARGQFLVYAGKPAKDKNFDCSVESVVSAAVTAKQTAPAGATAGFTVSATGQVIKQGAIRDQRSTDGQAQASVEMNPSTTSGETMKVSVDSDGVGYKTDSMVCTGTDFAGNAISAGGPIGLVDGQLVLPNVKQGETWTCNISSAVDPSQTLALMLPFTGGTPADMVILSGIGAVVAAGGLYGAQWLRRRRREHAEVRNG